MAAAASAACMVGVAGSASASLVYDANVFVSGQGFGNVPRVLTVQATGSGNTESGCISVNGAGALAGGSGSCITSGNVHDANAVQNAGGQEVNPLSDNQKFGIPSASSLGITTASQILIVYNATEPAGNSTNVTDVTLKFYSPTGSLLGAIDGQQDFANTVQGNGQAGFVFVVSQDELAYVNGILSANPNLLFAMETTITGVAGGPESYAILSRASVVPEPASIALFGAALFGFGVAQRRHRAARRDAA